MRSMLALSMCCAAAAVPTAGWAAQFDVMMGLPRVSTADPSGAAWRYMNMRLELGSVSIEAQLPSCVPTPVTAGACFDGRSRSQTMLASEQASVRWVAPRAVPNLDLSIAAHAWRTRGRSDDMGASGDGSALEFEVGRAVNSFYSYAGYGVPAQHGDAQAWRGVYGGVEWNLRGGATLVITGDDSREDRTGAHDRRISVRYSWSAGTSQTMSVFVTRQVDDTFAGWHAGLGAQWSF